MSQGKDRIFRRIPIVGSLPLTFLLMVLSCLTVLFCAREQATNPQATTGRSFRFTRQSIAALEGGNCSLEVARTDSTDRASVRIYTYDGSARSGGDYDAVSVTLLFQPGQASVDLTIPLADDSLVAFDKVFHAALASPSDGYVIRTGETATITIIDNETRDSGGPIHFPLEAGSSWKYRTYTWSDPGCCGGEHPVDATRTVTAVRDLRGRIYSSLQGSRSSFRWLRQEGNVVYWDDPDTAASYWWGRHENESRPWRLFDFGAPRGTEWSLFRDEVVYDEMHLVRVAHSVRSHGRMSVIVPAGIFHDVQDLEYLYDFEQTDCSACTPYARGSIHYYIADSVGIVKESGFYESAISQAEARDQAMSPGQPAHPLDSYSTAWVSELLEYLPARSRE